MDDHEALTLLLEEAAMQLALEGDDAAAVQAAEVANDRWRVVIHDARQLPFLRCPMRAIA